MPPVIPQVLRRLLLPVAVLFGVMVGLGLLATKVANDAWPLTVEDDINRDFEAHRTAPLNVISEIVSLIGSTPVIIAVTGVAAVILRLKLGRWREPLFLCLAVTAQALVFFFTTLVIDRERPAVHRMDDSPPTSSFPSGHTSAAVALYVGLALLLFTLLHQTWAKRLAWLLVLVPVAVACARLYRGMHHPTDVTASFLNGITCVVIMAREILNRAVRWAVPQRFRLSSRKVAH
ncbi:phosphatase PAP2 family protein [Actinoplanes solisilvae]|uniref:phosphatase PAP2 family protein n=1 Tax=Actinoplanes solisilvae TaxID=2486853 RepID=UPI000FD7FA96|nr:phosphatase PAP2 family protein [Actinoplanes solisilvae]